MNRQDLAMKLFVYGEHGPKKAFELADDFIAEADRQKAGRSVVERCEPKACEHAKLYRDAHGNCRKCGALLWGAEPPKPKMVKSNHTYLPDEYGDCVICGRARHEPAPKPERVAREWDVTISPVGWVVDTKFVYNQVSEKIRVREILPGDEK